VSGLDCGRGRDPIDVETNSNERALDTT
jgi:hypothetical protein